MVASLPVSSWKLLSSGRKEAVAPGRDAECTLTCSWFPICSLCCSHVAHSDRETDWCAVLCSRRERGARYPLQERLRLLTVTASDRGEFATPVREVETAKRGAARKITVREARFVACHVPLSLPVRQEYVRKPGRSLFATGASEALPTLRALGVRSADNLQERSRTGLAPAVRHLAVDILMFTGRPVRK